MKTKLMVKTKILSILLCAVMVLSELPFVALAAASGTDWLLDDDGLLTIESNAGIADWLVASSTNASQVEAVDIQNSVTTIDTGAFGDCTSLTSITFNSSNPPIFEDDVFKNVPGGLYVIVPAGAVTGYETALTGKLPLNAQFCVDITADFTDPNFLAAVRTDLGKGASDPIYDVDVASKTTLSADEKSITSLDGIEHFTELKSLDCNNNALTSLPELPSNLEWFYCDNNELKSLPELPSSLGWLKCDNNKLTSLPELPSELEWLKCDNNALKSLPELPSKLEQLECNNNALTSLPKLPSNLETLVCNNNALTSLPVLPSNLKMLDCNNNELTSLAVGNLSNLQYLYCSNNRLTELTLNNSAPYYGIDVRNNYMIDTSTAIKGKTIPWDTGEFTFTPQNTVPDTQTFPGEWKSDASGNPNLSSPQTGDNSNVLLWAILALLSMSGIAFTIFTKSKKYKE